MIVEIEAHDSRDRSSAKIAQGDKAITNKS